MDRLKCEAATVATCRPTLSEPVKEMTRGIGCSRKRHRSRYVGHDHVQQARGQPRVLEQLGDHGAAGDRGVLVRLEHHAVAEGQRGGDGLQRQQERHVEGADHADHADRLAVDAVLLAVDRRGQDAALGAQRQVDRLAQELLGQVEFEGGLPEGAAGLGHEDLADLGLALLDQPQHLLEHRAAGVGVGGGPLLLRAGGGPVRLVHLVGRGDGDRGQLLAVVRIEVDDVPGPCAWTPLAVDVLLSQVGEVGRHVIPQSPAAIDVTI